MANRDKPRYPPPGPAHPERMRDPDYVVRGYKAALFNRSTSSHEQQRTDPGRESWLTAWLEDISDEDRQRTRVPGLDRQQYDAASARVASEAREERRRRECGEETKPRGEEDQNEQTLQDQGDGQS